MSDNSEEINSSRQELFDHMSNEHGLTLLQSELMEIERIVLASEIERLMLSEEEIESLCKEHLKGVFDLSSFKKKRIIFLEIAFIGGANHAINHIKSKLKDNG